jgi:tRNA dimethylallyltransferase
LKKGRLIVIVGPTAVGKTEFAIRLAEHFQTEIISADSRQIYKEMTIGTAKPTESQLARVQHHFIDSHTMEDEYDAGQFGRDALAMISRLLDVREQVVLCGGSGLYIRAVCEGFDELPEVPQGVRDRIVTTYYDKGIEWLQQRVRLLDPEFFDEVDQKNPQRLMRALELLEASGKKMHELRKKKVLSHPFEICKIGLSLDREVLYQRIDQRMDQMMEEGLFEEAQLLYPRRHLNALQTVGYTEIFDFLDGKYDREEAVRLLKRNSRRYAKRQLTWFGREKDIEWFDARDPDLLLKKVLLFLEK